MYWQGGGFLSTLGTGIICDVTDQNQALVATCHLPQIQF